MIIHTRAALKRYPIGSHHSLQLDTKAYRSIKYAISLLASYYNAAAGVFLGMQMSDIDPDKWHISFLFINGANKFLFNPTSNDVLWLLIICCFLHRRAFLLFSESFDVNRDFDLISDIEWAWLWLPLQRHFRSNVTKLNATYRYQYFIFHLTTKIRYKYG